MTQTQKKKHKKNRPTDTNPSYQTEDHLNASMNDLNASLEPLFVTEEPLTGNAIDTNHTLDIKTTLRKGRKLKFKPGNSEEMK